MTENPQEPVQPDDADTVTDEEEALVDNGSLGDNPYTADPDFDGVQDPEAVEPVDTKAPEGSDDDG